MDFVDLAAIFFGGPAFHGRVFGGEPELQGGVNLGLSPILVAGLGRGGADPQVDYRFDGDGAYSRAFHKRDFQHIAGMERGRGFQGVAAALDFARRAPRGGEAAGLAKPHGPQPFVGAGIFGHGGFYGADRSNHSIFPVRAAAYSRTLWQNPAFSVRNAIMGPWGFSQQKFFARRQARVRLQLEFFSHETATNPKHPSWFHSPCAAASGRIIGHRLTSLFTAMIRNSLSRIGRTTYLIPGVGTKLRGLVESLLGPQPYQQRAYWNESLNGWASSYLGGTLSNQLRNAVTMQLANQVAPAARSLLDLGCAGATLARSLGPEFERYTGVDISDVAIATAREYLAATGSSLQHQLAVSTVQDYQPQRDFDVIVFNEVMYYLPLNQIAACVRRYAGFLTTNGVILVSLKDHEQCRCVQAAILQELDSVHAVLFQEQSGRAGWKTVRNCATPAFLVQAFRPRRR